MFPQSVKTFAYYTRNAIRNELKKPATLLRRTTFGFKKRNAKIYVVLRIICARARQGTNARNNGRINSSEIRGEKFEEKFGSKNRSISRRPCFSANEANHAKLPEKLHFSSLWPPLEAPPIRFFRSNASEDGLRNAKEGGIMAANRGTRFPIQSPLVRERHAISWLACCFSSRRPGRRLIREKRKRMKNEDEKIGRWRRGFFQRLVGGERERERESLEARRPWLDWGGPRDSDNDKPGRNRTVISASGRPSLLVFHGIR